MPVLFHRNFSLGTAVHILLMALVIGLLSGYAAFQARSIVRGPTISLSSEPLSVTGSSTIAVEGVAENIVSLSLNGRTIFTDDRGTFSETLVLPSGYTIMTLTAQDRYGRETSLTRTFVRTKDDV